MDLPSAPLRTRPDAFRPRSVPECASRLRGAGSGFGSPVMILGSPDGSWTYTSDLTAYGLPSGPGAGYGFDQADTR